MATYKSYSSHLGADGANPIQRVKPRLVVRRGYAGNETSALSRSLPPKAGEGIKSGQLVTPDANGAWVVAGNIAAAGKVYIAYHDQADPDVISCNRLLAFDLNGDYEFETGYYHDDGTPANIADGATLVCGKGAGKGHVAVSGTSTATSAAAVIGYVRGSIVDLAEGQYSASLDNQAQNTEAGGTSGSSAKVIRFVTA
jgi:hypothetical protein